MTVDLDKMLLNEGYTTIKQLKGMADRDSDRVSVFAAGSTWEDAPSAVFIVKGGALAKQIHDDLVAKGFITVGKPVVDETTEPPVWP